MLYTILYDIYTVYLAWIYAYRVLLPLLAAAVRHRVPHGENCCWLIESDSSVFFLLNVPLGSTVASTASICLYYIIGLTGMRGAKAGFIQPAAAKPPLHY